MKSTVLFLSFAVISRVTATNCCSCSLVVFSTALINNVVKNSGLNNKKQQHSVKLCMLYISS